MIYLNSKTLLLYEPTSNMVLVKPTRGNDEFILPNGEKIFLDISYNKEMHAPVTGIVVACPNKIWASDAVLDEYGEIVSGHLGMQWDVDMELAKDDVVTYSYLSATTVLDPNEGKMIMCENQVYFLIPYEECFVAKRPILGTFNPEHGGVYNYIIPLNGYCLVEPVEEKTQQKAGAIILEKSDAFAQQSIRYGKIAYTSKSLIRKYVDGDGAPDIDNVKVGDYIAFDIGCDLLCEYDLHASIEGKKQFYRMQRRHIHAIISETII